MYTKVIIYQKGVYIYYYHKGEILRIPTNVQLKEKPKTRKNKDGKTIKYYNSFKDGQVTYYLKNFEGLNRQINLVKNAVDKIISEYFNKELKKPSVNYVKDQYFFEDKGEDEAIKSVKANTLFKEFIEYKEGKVNVPSSVKDYKSLYNALRFYQYKTKKILTVHDVNSITFFSKFETFIKKPHVLTPKEKKEYKIAGGLNANTVLKRMSGLRSFMIWCKKEETVDENKIKDEPTASKKYKTTPIILEDIEIKQLMNLQLNIEKEVKTRDLLVFLSLTGTRFSDAIRLNKTNLYPIDGGSYLLKKIAKKVTYNFEVPLLPEAYKIFKKYDFNLNFFPSQMFNRYIKELLVKYNICNYEIPIVEVNHEDEPEKNVIKFTKISSHTGRRTFITRAIRAGVSLDVIMAATSHRKLDTILEYMKIFGNKNHKDIIDKLRL